MRKNGINRELLPISGGVCAPDGFKASGVFCGIDGTDKKDLALIHAEKRCPAAAVFSQCNPVGAPIQVSKKHLKNGYAHTIVINSGIANVFLSDGVKLADNICRLVEKDCNVIKEDVLIASTGKIGKPLPYEPFIDGVKRATMGLGANDANSYSAAQAIATKGEVPKQISFAFKIGDISCKIGAIFKGSTRVSPNMATTLVFLTTDVCITPEMLQKALSSEVKETLNLLTVDGVPSPNDAVMIMANGRAGNWCISNPDTDYKKFAYALRSVLFEVCREIIKNTPNVSQSFYCRVSGARSKQLVRILAKRFAGSSSIRAGIQKRKIDVESILYILSEEGAMEEYNTVRISVQSSKGGLVLFEDGEKLPYDAEVGAEILSPNQVWLCVEIGDGNYQSLGCGCIYAR